MSPAQLRKLPRGFLIVATQSQPKKLTAKLWRLNGLRLFAGGVARGQKWTEQDIDAMVENGRQYADLIRPTLVIGHEENQSLAEGMPATVEQNTGQPAFGRIENLRKEWGKDDKGQRTPFLVGDAKDVPHWLAAMLAGKHYVDRSVEIYDEPPDGLEKAKGAILRRVALLGGELPQIKTLGEMPAPELQAFVERRELAITARPLRYVGVTIRPQDHTRLVRFSECRTMARSFKKYADCSPKTQAGMKKFADLPADGDTSTPDSVSHGDMIEMLTDYGVDPAVLEKLDDDALAELIRVLSSQMPEETKPDETPPADNKFDGSNELRGKNQAGQLAAINAKDPEGDYHPSKHTYAADENSTLSPTARSPTVGSGMTPMNQPAQPTSLTVKFSEKQITEMNTRAEAIEKRLTALDRLSASRVADEKKAGFSAFCESQVKAGKLLPAWVEAGLVEVAMKLDAVDIHKFSDGKQATALDKFKRIIESGPNLLAFTERMPNGKSDAEAADHEEGRVKQHFHKFSESFKKQAVTEEKLVAGFRAAKARVPDTTADSYLGAGVA